MCERFNRTLIQMLRALDADQRQHWTAYVPELLWAYNNRVHATTGFTPHMLMFGRPGRDLEELQLPGDCQPPPRDASDWMRAHRRRLRIVHRIVEGKLAQVEHANPRPVHTDPFNPGDAVLVRVKRPRDKLDLRWEAEPYIIKRRVSPDNPVYEVVPRGAEGPSRILHREMLRPCGFRVDDTPRVETDGQGGGGETPVSEDWWGEPDDVPTSIPLSPRMQRHAPEPVPPSPQVIVPTPMRPDLATPSAPLDAPPVRRSERSTAGVPPSRYADIEWELTPGTAISSGVECGGLTAPHVVNAAPWQLQPRTFTLNPQAPAFVAPPADPFWPVWGAELPRVPFMHRRGCHVPPAEAARVRNAETGCAAEGSQPGSLGEAPTGWKDWGLLCGPEVAAQEVGRRPFFCFPALPALTWREADVRPIAPAEGSGARNAVTAEDPETPGKVKGPPSAEAGTKTRSPEGPPEGFGESGTPDLAE